MESKSELVFAFIVALSSLAAQNGFNLEDERKKDENDEITKILGKTEMRWHTSSSKSSFKLMKEKFYPRKTDIIIATSSKTGTTLMQQMCHQIRTGGDEDFTDIYYAVPWIVHFGDFGQDPDANHVVNPRIFKSHQMISALYGCDCRYIITVRRPENTYKSFYNFLINLGVIDSDVCTIDQFIQHACVHGTDFAPLFECYVEYWKIAHLKDHILILAYEDILTKKREIIYTTAKFMDVPCDEELVNIVENYTSRKYMSRPDIVGKFDGSVTNSLVESGEDVTILQSAPRATDGSHQKNLKLSEETKKLMEEQWMKVVYPVTKCKTYEEYKNQLIEKNRFQN